MPRKYLHRPLLVCIFLLFSALGRAAEPRWIRISSGHYSVITDAEEKRGHEVAARFEQMRLVFSQVLMRSRVNLPEPLEIIALSSNAEYMAVVPLHNGKPIVGPGFFLSGDDRNFVVLDLSQNESWRAVGYDFARMLLNYNYPPVPPWFDEGFAEYLSTLRINSKGVEIGGDPGWVPPLAKSYSETLSSQTWLPLTQLLQTKANPGNRDSRFSAESWIVMHYLLNKNKLEETGTFFDLAQNQGLSIGDAIQKAFGVSSAQLEQSIKDYFTAILPTLQNPTAKGAPALASPPTVAADEEIGMSMLDISESEGKALIAEMALRSPGREEQAKKTLEEITSQPKTNTSVAHRALAWSYLKENKYQEAVEELGNAAELDSKDPWLHYYLALVKFHVARASGQPFQGLANMMQDLRVVLDWDPEFAEAYAMLGMARVEGGGTGSAMESMRAAIRLSPRNQDYLLDMAQIYMAAKEWKAATAMLQRLSASDDPKIAEAAKKTIADLPTIEKYGIQPQHDTGTTTAPGTTTSLAKPIPSIPPPPPPKAAIKTPAPAASSGDTTDSDNGEPPPPPKPDIRPIQFAKGKLIAVDCSHDPQAILTISTATRLLKLMTTDYKSLTLIGADNFSCGWQNKIVSVNYKTGGEADGDLVSLEMH